MAGKTTMNEDVFSSEHGDFQANHISFRGLSKTWRIQPFNPPSFSMFDASGMTVTGRRSTRVFVCVRKQSKTLSLLH